MLKRIITGVVLLAVAGGLIVVQGWYLRAALLIMALTSFFEMYRAFRRPGRVTCSALRRRFASGLRISWRFWTATIF